MEWMQCNSCWVQVQNKSSEFYLTQCGHVYCNKCIVQAEKFCQHCNTVGTISLSLKEPLNQQIAHYFTKPMDLIDKLIQAEQFQESQRNIYRKHSETQQKKYETLKEAFWANGEEYKKLHQKYNKLKLVLIATQKQKKLSAIPSSSPFVSRQHFQAPSNQASGPQGKYNPPHFQATPNQASGPQGKYNPPSAYGRKEDKTPMTNDGFRVPNSTRVPKSAGYYTASSLSSDGSSCRSQNTPFSRYSHS